MIGAMRTSAFISRGRLARGFVRPFASPAKSNRMTHPSVAVVGVTGAVGQELLKLLESRRFPFSSLKLLASARSAGREMRFMGETYMVEELTEASFADVDIALFSAGGAQSLKYAPAAVEAGVVVVDNSSAFRMHPEVPLVVPEVNAAAVATHRGIIANPNCSTIIMAVPVWALHRHTPVQRVCVSTYQAASGAGAAAMQELEQQARDWAAGVDTDYAAGIFGRQYMWNLFSHNSAVDALTGYNEEELKMVHETQKIFGQGAPAVTATCVRVPVLRAHCEAINLTFAEPGMDEHTAREILTAAPGVTVVDNREANSFPEPVMASGQDDVFVGRVRGDLSQPEGRGLEIFVAGDQIRKGAALNAIQIAELLVHQATCNKPESGAEAASEATTSSPEAANEGHKGGLSVAAWKSLTQGIAQHGSTPYDLSPNTCSVLKFGGSSVADAAQISRVLDIVHAKPSRRYVVVSAPGKRDSSDTKVTDRLYQCHTLAEDVRDGLASHAAFDAHYDNTVRSRYLEIAAGLGLCAPQELAALHAQLDAACQGIYDAAHRRGGPDFAASRGEHLCAATLALALGWEFVDAADGFIHFDDQNELDVDRTQRCVAARLAGLGDAQRVVIPGFYGQNSRGEVTTFPRGGSDITGAIVAAALQAPGAPVLYENWTDVGGVYSTDPRVVPHARAISKLTYQELFALSSAGAGVLHPAAVAPAVRARVPIHIRDTNHPEEAGTIVDGGGTALLRWGGQAPSLKGARGEEAVVGLVGNFAALNHCSMLPRSSIAVVCRSGHDADKVQAACRGALTQFAEPSLSQLISVLSAGDSPRWHPNSSVASSEMAAQPSDGGLCEEEFNQVLAAVYDTLDQQGMLLR